MRIGALYAFKKVNTGEKERGAIGRIRGGKSREKGMCKGAIPF